MFSNDVAKQKQTISFCRENAHYQNGLTEKAICNLQEQARTILLHAQARWSQVIHTSLWPNALRTVCYVRHTAFSRQYPVMTRKNCRSSSMFIPQTYTHIWLPNLCSTFFIGSKQVHSKMGHQSKTWGVFWSITMAHTVTGIGSQPHHWLGLSTVLCHF